MYSAYNTIFYFINLIIDINYLKSYNECIKCTITYNTVEGGAYDTD